MLSLGIISSYYPKDFKEAIREIKKDGFTCLVLENSVGKTDLEDLDAKQCREIRNVIRDEGLYLAAISADANIVASDPEKRKNNIGRVKKLIKLSNELGSPYVVSEVGTFSKLGWTHHEKNDTEEGYQEAYEIVLDIVKYAYDYGATFLVEPYIATVINSVEKVQRLFADLHHGSLGLLMDVSNYFSVDNIDNMDSEIDRIFNAVGDKVKIAHAKDLYKTDKADYPSATERHLHISGGIALPAPGLGILNHKKVYERLYRIDPNMPLIIEHIDYPDIKRCKKFLDDVLKEIGR
ncbi:MAG TPA: sugar phosphate isomerase/epimerase [Anaerovoracaceae bacterium]|nr:sugar phosphate isomerase/epimerase [Anaerovoracaceae bacterium]